MENRVKDTVEAIGTFRLFLDTGYHLDLFQILYVPSLSRNLVLLSKLNIERYSFKFGNKSVSLFKNTSFIDFGILHEGLYQLKLNDLFAEILLTLHHNVGTKHSRMDENYSILWHK